MFVDMKQEVGGYALLSSAKLLLYYLLHSNFVPFISTETL